MAKFFVLPAIHKNEEADLNILHISQGIYVFDVKKGGQNLNGFAKYVGYGIMHKEILNIGKDNVSSQRNIYVNIYETQNIEKEKTIVLEENMQLSLNIESMCKNCITTIT